MNDLKSLSKIDSFVLALSLILIATSLYYISPSSIIKVGQNGDLTSVIHTKHNAYFHLTTLGSWIASSFGCSVLFLSGLLGLTIALSYHGVLPTLSLAIAATTYAVCSAVFGDDFIVLGPLVFLPYMYIIIHSARSAKPAMLVLLAVAIIALWLALYSLSLPVLLLAILANFIINQKSLPKLTSISLCLYCAVLFFLNAASPALIWPDYPDFARITQMMDGPAYIARPLVGSDLPFPAVERSLVKSEYNFLILPLAVLLLSVGLLTKLGRTARMGLMVSAMSLSFAYLDLKLSEDLAQISPLQSLSRLLPELNLIPLAPVALGISIVSLILLAMLTFLRSSTRILISLSSALILVLCAQVRIIDDSMSALPETWHKSPSRFTTNFFNPEILRSAQGSWKRYLPKTTEVKEIGSSSGPVQSEVLLDKNEVTRWSPNSGKQSGTEWIQIELTEPHRVLGIELQTGNFHTDFARGLKIRAGIDCSATSLKVLSNFPNWQGHPKFTPKGYPYFSGQSEVLVFFTEEVEAACFRIEQTGKSDHYDWSVADFRLIKKQNN